MATSNIPDILFDVNYSFPPSEVNTCNVCSEVLKSRTKLADHLLVRHQAKLFWICSKCRVSTSANDRAMRSHYKQCTKDGDDSTPFVSQLLSRSLPEVKSNETVLSFPPANTECKECQMRFSSRAKLEQHYKISHKLMVKWNCSWCGSYTASSAASISGHFSKCKRHSRGNTDSRTSCQVGLVENQGCTQDLSPHLAEPAVPPMPSRPVETQSGSAATRGDIGTCTSTNLDNPINNVDTAISNDNTLPNETEPERVFCSENLTNNVNKMSHDSNHIDSPRLLVNSPDVSQVHRVELSCTDETDLNQVFVIDPVLSPLAALTDNPFHNEMDQVSPNSINVGGRLSISNIARVDGSNPEIGDNTYDEVIEPDSTLTNITPSEQSPTDTQVDDIAPLQTDPAIRTRTFVSAPMAYGRWSETDIRILANLELDFPETQFINQKLQTLFTSRSVMSISQMRSTLKYKKVLQEERHKRNLADIPCRTGVGALHELSSDINFGLDIRQVVEDLAESGIVDETLARNLVSAPLLSSDLKDMYKKFGVKIKSKPKGKRKEKQNMVLERDDRKSRRRKRYREHQRLFGLGPKVLLQELEKKENNENPITLGDIHGTFDKLFSSPSPAVSSDGVTTEEMRVLGEGFLWDEVETARKQLQKGSSPGLDGVSVTELKKIPTPILAHIFNNWLVFKQIPEDLKLSKTVFIPKKENFQTPEDLRPITIAPIIVRLFSKILLARFTSCSSFHPFQNGFENDRGTSTNIILLQATMKHAKKNKHPIYCASLDLRKAFDSVSHYALLEALRRRGAPMHYLELLKSLYTNCQTTYFWEGMGDSIRVPLNRGIKQGDPLSPFLFNAVLDPLLHLLNSSGVGYDVNGHELGAMAYADDIILISKSLEGMNALIRMVTTFFNSCHLTLNPTKTQYFGWTFDSYKKWFNYNLPELQIEDYSVKPVSPNTPIRYLGIDFFINKPCRATIMPTIQQLALIRKAALKPFQKLQCITTLLLPKHLYAVSNSLSYKQDGESIDKHFRIAIKDILHLPQSFPTSHIHLQAKKGGLGVLSVLNVGAEVQFKAFCRMQRLGNPFIDSLVPNILNEHLDKLSNFLKIPRGISSHEDIKRAMKESREKRYSEQKLEYTNKSLFSHENNVLGNAWLRPDCKFLSDGDRIKALRLRTNLVPTRVLTNRLALDPKTRLCRRCHRAEETACHILQDCSEVQLPRIERHNFLVDQIARLVKKHNPSWDVQREVTHVRPGQGTLRPDLVIKTTTSTIISDVAVTWDACEATLDRMNRSKQCKYECLRSLYTGESSVLGLSFGARSFIAKSTKKNGLALGITESDLAWLASRTLVGSLIMLNRFSKMVK